MLSEGKSALVGFSITVGCHILCSQKLKIKLTKRWKRKAHSKSSDAARLTGPLRRYLMKGREYDRMAHPFLLPPQRWKRVLITVAAWPKLLLQTVIPSSIFRDKHYREHVEAFAQTIALVHGQSAAVHSTCPRCRNCHACHRTTAWSRRALCRLKERTPWLALCTALYVVLPWVVYFVLPWVAIRFLG